MQNTNRPKIDHKSTNNQLYTYFEIYEKSGKQNTTQQLPNQGKQLRPTMRMSLAKRSRPKKVRAQTLSNMTKHIGHNFGQIYF